MAVPNTPIVNAGLKYINDLQLIWVDGTHIDIVTGACRDSLNVNDIVLPQAVNSTGTPLTINGLPLGAAINGAVVGPNGVDVAVITGTQFYRVYIIADSTGYKPTAGILSLNASAPNLPLGYDMYRGIGYVNVVSNVIVKFYQYGNGGERSMYYDLAISIPATPGSTGYSGANLSNGVPASLTCEVFLSFKFGAVGAVTDILYFAPFGSASATGLFQFACGTALQYGNAVIPSALNGTVPQVNYKMTDATDTLTILVTGYRETFT